MVRAAAAVASVSLLVAGCSAGGGVERRAGDLVVEDSPAGDDRIDFYLPEDAEEEAATKQAEEAIGKTTLEIRSLEYRSSTESRPARVRVETYFDSRAGALRREIDARDLPPADGRILLETSAGVRLESGGELVESTPLGRTYEVRRTDLVLSYSAAHLALLLLLIVALIVAPLAGARMYVSRLRDRDIEKVEKAYRLQRVMLFASFGLPLAAIAAGIGSGAVELPGILLGIVYPDAPEVVAGLSSMAGIFLLFVAVTLALVTGLQPYYRELRVIDQTPAEGRRRAARGFIGFVPVVVWIVFLAVAGRLFEGTPWLRGAASIVFILTMWAIGPLLVAQMFGRAELDPLLRERLLDFARRHGFKVRDVRAVQGRKEKHGNAMVVGVLPRLKYIFLTDYLIERLGEDELMAIVAHEIGHGKKRHTLVKVGVPLLCLLAIGGLIVGLMVLDVFPEGALPFFLFGFPLLMIASLVLAQGIVGMRLEHSADDFACETVGVDATARALEKLAEINMTKRRTGRMFNLFAQHPAIEDRIERVKQKEQAA